jgi:hypothetical protein
MLPPTIDCPHCDASLSLDDRERAVKRFVCPACKMKIDLRIRQEEQQNHISIDRLPDRMSLTRHPFFARWGERVASLLRGS